MGDILTHAEITHYVISELKKIQPNENYIYLEIGNYLRDISQFRDPYAYLKAKDILYWKALQNKPFLPPILGPLLAKPTANLPKWLDTLMGEESNRHGLLAQFFTEIAKASVHYIFSNITPSPLPILFLKNIKRLSPQDIDIIFHKEFTQYYPHEHLDFPPYKESLKQKNDKRYNLSKTGFIGYLNEQITYLSEELSFIELKLLLTKNKEIKGHLLVRLGRVLHAIEDFFFHSNYIEVYYLNDAKRKLHYQDMSNQYIIDKIKNCNHKKLSKEKKNLLKRKFFRRIRYPIFKRDRPSYITYHSKSESKDSSNMIYTGGFSSSDIYHTLHGALAALEKIITSTIPNKKKSSFALLNVVLNEEVRRKMIKNEDYTDKLLLQHKNDLTKNRYFDKIEQAKKNKKITRDVANALQHAFKLDLELENMNDYTPGIGGFLILLLKEAQQSADESNQRIQKLNMDSKNNFNSASDNGSSAELVGQHSLLAKDTKKSQPFRKESLLLAKHASASIAYLLINRINKNKHLSQGLHWDKILNHYMRYPEPRKKNRWESFLIKQSKNPDFKITNNTDIKKDIKDVAKYQILSRKKGFDLLKKRRKGIVRTKLEKAYKDLESRI